MNGRKPTREERKLFDKLGLDTYEWLIQKITPEFIQVVNRKSGEELAIRIDNI